MSAPDAMTVAEQIELYDRMWAMASAISDAADEFIFWAREQSPAVRQAAETVDRKPIDVIKTAIEDDAVARFGPHDIVPKTVADAVLLIDYNPDATDSVIEGLRAIAEAQR